MLLIVAALLGLAAGLLTGGRLANLANIRFHWPLVVLLGVLVKELGVLAPPAFEPLVPVVYAGSLAILLAWAVWHLRVLPALWLAVVGLAANTAVVLANGGRMPVRAGAGSLDLAGRGGHVGQYALAGPETRLNWLGDWIALPQPLGRLFPQAYSPGDLVLFAGLALACFMATRAGGRAVAVP